MKNKLKQQTELNNFLADFLIEKKAKIQELSALDKEDYDNVEKILKNRIRLHKEDKQESKPIMDIIGEYVNSNF